MLKGVVTDALLDPGCFVGIDSLYATEDQAIERSETKLWMMTATGMSWENLWRRARSTRLRGFTGTVAAQQAPRMLDGMSFARK